MKSSNALTILSMGLGRDSVAMLCLLKEGRLMIDGVECGPAAVDAVVFSDTGAEWRHTLDLVPAVTRMCLEMGVPFFALNKPQADGPTGWRAHYAERVRRVAALPQDATSNQRTAAGKFAPAWVVAAEGLPMHAKAAAGAYHWRAPIRDDFQRLERITLRANAGCTGQHKIAPIRRFLDDLSKEAFGVSTAKGGWSRLVKAGERTKHRVLIGIAADETARLKTPTEAARRSGFSRSVYPLAEAGVTKADEGAILGRHGLGHVRKSGCVSCHYQTAGWWWALSVTDPETYRAAVLYEKIAIDAAVRDTARGEKGRTVKYLGGSSAVPDRVDAWRARHPSATPDGVLAKEYSRKKEERRDGAGLVSIGAPRPRPRPRQGDLFGGVA